MQRRFYFDDHDASVGGSEFDYIPDNIRRLFDSWSVEEFREGVDRLMKEDPGGTRRLFLEIKRKLQEGSIKELQRLGLLQEPMLQTVATAFFALSRRAQQVNWSGYVKFVHDFEEETHDELNWIRTADYRGLFFLPDYSNVDQVLSFLRTGLEYYVARLRYYVDLAEVAAGRSADVARIRRMGWADLEGRLSASAYGVGKGVMMGEELRHIRNSLTHGSYRLDPRRRVFAFRDHNPRSGRLWKEHYAYGEFIALHRIFLLVYMGVDLARSMEVYVSYELMAVALGLDHGDRS